MSLVALKGKQSPSEEELYKYYVKEGKSIDEIAKIYRLSHPPIMRLFKKYNIKTRTRKQAALNRRRKLQQRALENFDYETYKGVRGMIELFLAAADDEEVRATIKGITLDYLDKLRNLYDTIGEDNIEEELCLIAQNYKNKLEPLLLHCLHKASLKTGIRPDDIKDDIKNDYCGEFETIQRNFCSELRKVYIKLKYEIIRENIPNSFL